jgi:CRISPR type III-A-associated protein Csm2
MEQRRIDSRLKKIIAQGDTDTLISYALELGQRVAGEDLGRTQMRNIYGMVKAFEAKQPREYDELKLLIPKLHYAAARESKLQPLVEALEGGILLIEGREERFKRFASFFEAVVAYHYAETEKRKRGR